MRAVKFGSYGDVDVLHVADVEQPQPIDDQLRIRVRAAGTNPGEVAIRSGDMDAIAPAHFPEGQGTDLAGVVDAVGPGVTGIGVGDALIGWSASRGGQADFAIVTSDSCLPKPPTMAWNQAAVIPTVAATATAAVQALGARDGETVVVAGAAGGVGSLVVQLLRRAGARVVGTASERHHAYVRSLGAEPVTYGDDAAERIQAIAPSGVAAFADCAGHGNVDLAVELGVAAGRINTTIDFETASRVGAQTRGMYQLGNIRDAVMPIVDLVAADQLAIPVGASFPLEQVRDAYTALEGRRDIGKIVLTVSSDD